MARYFWRDAVTGQLVSKAYAEANPDTTMRHEMPVDEQETDSRGDLYYDADTMKKVDNALQRAGITGVWTRTAIITELQNAGILFRERGRL